MPQQQAPPVNDSPAHLARFSKTRTFRHPFSKSFRASLVRWGRSSNSSVAIPISRSSCKHAPFSKRRSRRCSRLTRATPVSPMRRARSHRLSGRSSRPCARPVWCRPLRPRLRSQPGPRPRSTHCLHSQPPRLCLHSLCCLRSQPPCLRNPTLRLRPLLRRSRRQRPNPLWRSRPRFSTRIPGSLWRMRLLRRR